jgi:hypothetical protein
MEWGESVLVQSALSTCVAVFAIIATVLFSKACHFIRLPTRAQEAKLYSLKIFRLIMIGCLMASQGAVVAIGISNFQVDHVQDIARQVLVMAFWSGMMVIT